MSTIDVSPRTTRSGRRRTLRLAALATLTALTVAACGSDDDGAAATTAPSDTTAPGAETTAPAEPAPSEVKLGFFPNVTHAPALVGVAESTLSVRWWALPCRRRRSCAPRSAR